MKNSQDKDLIIKTQQERIDHIEGAYKKILENLSTLASTREFSKDMTIGRVPSTILTIGITFIKRLLDFKEMAFYLIDEEDSSFAIEHCEPEASRAELQAEVDRFIEEGTFAWALRQNHPVIVPSKSSGLTFIFHVIATQSRTRGMFVGAISPSELSITDPSMAMLSITVQNISYSLENAILYRSLNDRAASLEEQVKRRTAELLREKENADAANRAKSEFLASMSHELRTPLNGIIGLTEIVLEAEPDSKQREHLNMILESARMLLYIINDILDFSKIEAGKMELENHYFNLPHLMRSVVEPLEMVARARGLHVELNMDEGLPTNLSGDASRLRQLLFNLLGNAVKFTSKGKCSVHVGLMEPQDESGGRVGLRFTVTDTGIGIPHDKLKVIFGKFSQADQSVSRRFGGTGLGLAISKSLANLMGGDITVDSTPGKGSTFTVTAHFDLALGQQHEAREESPKESSPDAPAQASLRVLLAEDNRINQVVAKAFLEREGHSVYIANSGAEALAALAAEAFDLILMDVEMPEMDGIEATRRIRSCADGTLNQSIPIIALTAHVMPGYKEMLFSEGMDHYISKPLEQTALTAALRTVMNGKMALSELGMGAIVQQPKITADKVIDIDATLSRLGNDRQLFDLTRQTYEEEAPKSSSKLAEELKRGDAGAARLEAHSFKNLAMNIGAGRLSDLVRKIEYLCAEGNLDDARSEFANIARELEAVTRELASKLGKRT